MQEIARQNAKAASTQHKVKTLGEREHRLRAYKGSCSSVLRGSVCTKQAHFYHQGHIECAATPCSSCCFGLPRRRPRVVHLPVVLAVWNAPGLLLPQYCALVLLFAPAGQNGAPLVHVVFHSIGCQAVLHAMGQDQANSTATLEPEAAVVDLIHINCQPLLTTSVRLLPAPASTR